jgi:hypothetical protein
MADYAFRLRSLSYGERGRLTYPPYGSALTEKELQWPHSIP